MQLVLTQLAPGASPPRTSRQAPTVRKCSPEGGDRVAQAGLALQHLQQIGTVHALSPKQDCRHDLHAAVEGGALNHTAHLHQVCACRPAVRMVRSRTAAATCTQRGSVQAQRTRWHHAEHRMQGRHPCRAGSTKQRIARHHFHFRACARSPPAASSCAIAAPARLGCAHNESARLRMASSPGMALLLEGPGGAEAAGQGGGLEKRGRLFWHLGGADAEGRSVGRVHPSSWCCPLAGPEWRQPRQTKHKTASGPGRWCTNPMWRRLGRSPRSVRRGYIVGTALARRPAPKLSGALQRLEAWQSCHRSGMAMRSLGPCHWSGVWRSGCSCGGRGRCRSGRGGEGEGEGGGNGFASGGTPVATQWALHSRQRCSAQQCRFVRPHACMQQPGPAVTLCAASQGGLHGGGRVVCSQGFCHGLQTAGSQLAERRAAGAAGHEQRAFGPAGAQC